MGGAGQPGPSFGLGGGANSGGAGGNGGPSIGVAAINSAGLSGAGAYSYAGAAGGPRDGGAPRGGARAPRLAKKALSTRPRQAPGADAQIIRRLAHDLRIPVAAVGEDLIAIPHLAADRHHVLHFADDGLRKFTCDTDHSISQFGATGGR